MGSSTLHFLAAFERPRKRHLVGEFEVGPDGNTTCNPRDLDSPVDEVLVEEVRSGLALRSRIRGEDDLPDVLVLNALVEFTNPKIVRPNPVQRRKRTPKDVVVTPKGAALFNGDDVTRLLNDAEDAGFAANVRAQVTGLGLGDVSATLTGPDFLANSVNRPGKIESFLFVASQKIEGQSLGRLLPDGREPGKMLDELFQIAGAVLHESDLRPD